MNLQFEDILSTDTIDTSTFEKLHLSEFTTDPSFRKIYLEIQTLAEKLFQIEAEMKSFKRTLEK